MKNSYFVLVLPVLLLALLPLGASAATVVTGKTVSVPETQLVADNAYIAGGEVNFLTTAQKDLVAAGGRVLINGPVWGDALVAGGTVEILKDVRGDVRAAGGQVTIAGNVTGDVVVGGGVVSILPGAVIGGDVIIAGGTLNMEGAVNGSLKAYGGDVMINATVAGPVTITAGKSVSFGDKTVLGSTLTYSAPAEAAVAAGAKLGTQVVFTKGATAMPRAGDVKAIVLAILGFLIFAKFIGMLVAALVMVLVFKNFSKTLSERVLAHFWKKTLIGFVALIVTPIAALLFALTIIGLYIGLFIGIIYVMALLLGGVYMGILAGALLSKWIKKEAVVDWKWTILGTFAVFLLGFVPIVGWIIDLVLFFAALGAIVMSIHRDAEAKM